MVKVVSETVMYNCHDCGHEYKAEELSNCPECGRPFLTMNIERTIVVPAAIDHIELKITI